MKTKFTFLSIIVIIVISSNTSAQNVFPSTGRVGIYTTSPATSLQVRGGARIGSTTNYTSIDSATGNLSFVGNAAYKVAGNKYAFQFSGNSNYGLFFNSTNVQYEFRNGSAVPVFYVNANSGNGVFNGTLKVGAYTLPATDGTNGQVLKTNGAGALAWSNDNSSGGGNAWSLTGNAGTDPSINFIGTTDAQSLVFKVNGFRAGLIDYSTCCSGTRNTAFGQIALNFVTAGADNTAVGYGTLYTNTTGNQNAAYGKYALFNNNADNNTAIGFNAMFFNTTGINNTASGSVALQNNTTGQQNTANGFAALASNSTGSYNIAVGSAALNSNTTGIWNSANGSYALYLNTTGYNNTASGGNALYNNNGTDNTANGYNALYSNTSGFGNTAIGSGCLYNNTSGSLNTAAGIEALNFNTTGGSNTAFGYEALLTNTTGNSNTAVGHGTLISNTSGSLNTALGYECLNWNTVGKINTAIGNTSMYNNTTGNNNVGIGYFTLFSNKTGSNNIGIGTQAGLSVENLSYTIAIGAYSDAAASNQVRIGSVGDPLADPTSIGGKVSWSTLSDGRVKKNIRDNVPGLLFINKLKPITYNIDNKAIDQIVQRPVIKNKNSVEMKLSADELATANENAKTIYTGFVAQDVEKAAKSLNYDFSGVDAAKNDKDLYGLRYAEFVVPLVKAVQELSKMNDDKDKKINEQDEKINDLQKQIDELKALITSSQPQTIKQQSAVISNASLEQNIPNPFANTTTINYTLPQTNSIAQIIIRDKTGKNLKTIDVSGSGKGSLKVDATTLASGAYSYSLIVNGKLIGTKEMILAK
ncbi:hypothetical protein FRZ67_20890 [Panacibacter ginsenosidivorans]|uniref:Peptidase S74 domain-containing protein n=1 Tax=Panacibacter ginsenosidivorans TaxID=1813871 RepID=A0A5B8VH49_9BACT|nr:tail fiber domain-containing protein [Panacibacter ginsenosidivorans]QEC69638.1 hypothetical protein FRZ67_20890 [Panacibacter ginsenosidivorans]